MGNLSGALEDATQALTLAPNYAEVRFICCFNFWALYITLHVLNLFLACEPTDYNCSPVILKQSSISIPLFSCTTTKEKNILKKLWIILSSELSKRDLNDLTALGAI